MMKVDWRVSTISILFIALVVWIIYVFSSIYKNAKQSRMHIEQMQEYIGEYMVIDSDTLMITNYIPHKHTFDLSNKTVAHEKLVEKNIIDR